MNNRCPSPDKPAALPRQDATVRRWRTFVLAVVALAGVLARPDNVSAQGYWAWAPLGVGCARSISVGPNGVPWILGCTGGDPNGTGLAWVYFLTWSSPPGSLFPVYQWNYDNISALTLYVNLNGLPYVTDIVGDVWYETGNYTGSLPSTEEPTGIWSLARPCCVGAIAVGVSRTVPSIAAGEMFYPPQNTHFSDGQLLAQTTMWGFGCRMIICFGGGPFNGSSFWEADFPYVQHEPWAPGQTPWSQLPGLPGGATPVTITMFTDPDNSSSPQALDVQQIPWALTTSGDIYAWQIQYGWVQVALPEPAAWITDGAMLGQSGTLYACFTTQCYSGHPSPGDWYALILPYTTNGPVRLKEIAMGGAVSQAIVGGPPDLIINSLPPTGPIAWAIDYGGNIYFSQYITPEPI